MAPGIWKKNLEMSLYNYSEISDETKKEIIAYFEDHTAEECSDKFGIVHYGIYDIIRRDKSGNTKVARFKGGGSNTKFNDELKKEIVEYYKDHTSLETQKKYSISSATINSYCIQQKVKKDSNYVLGEKLKSGQALNLREEQKAKIVEYYKTHTRDETALHFNISPSTISNYKIQSEQALKSMERKSGSKNKIKESVYETFEIAKERPLFELKPELSSLPVRHTPAPTITKPLSDKEIVTQEVEKKKAKIAVFVSDDMDSILEVLKGL